MNDILWLLISFLYILAVLLAAYCMGRRGVQAIFVRKTVHILVSLWIFIMAYGMESPVARLAGPVLFTALNLAFYIHSGNISAGIVFFPLSITVMIFLMIEGILSVQSVVAGTLVMGLGDGAAAIAGTLLGKTRKSIEGSAVMFIVAFNVILACTGIGVIRAAVSALAATVAERVSPSALDNLTVPLLAAGAVEVLCAL